MGSLRSTSLAAGVDPINDRIGARPQEAAAQLKTVREVAALYLAKNEARWGAIAEHRGNWKRSLDQYVHPTSRATYIISDLEAPHVLKVVDPIWRRFAETWPSTSGAARRTDRLRPHRWPAAQSFTTRPDGRAARRGAAAAAKRIRRRILAAMALVRRSARLHGPSSQPARRCRPRLEILDPDRDAHERNALRDMGRNRRRRFDVSWLEADENAQAASCAAVASRAWKFRPLPSANPCPM